MNVSHLLELLKLLQYLRLLRLNMEQVFKISLLLWFRLCSSASWRFGTLCHSKCAADFTDYWFTWPNHLLKMDERSSWLLESIHSIHIFFILSMKMMKSRGNSTSSLKSRTYVELFFRLELFWLHLSTQE